MMLAQEHATLTKIYIYMHRAKKIDWLKSYFLGLGQKFYRLIKSYKSALHISRHLWLQGWMQNLSTKTDAASHPVCSKVPLISDDQDRLADQCCPFWARWAHPFTSCFPMDGLLWHWFAGNFISKFPQNYHQFSTKFPTKIIFLIMGKSDLYCIFVNKYFKSGHRCVFWNRNTVKQWHVVVDVMLISLLGFQLLTAQSTWVGPLLLQPLLN